MPWAETQARLAQAQLAARDSWLGPCVDWSSPMLPTISIRAHAWQAGWKSERWSHRANAIHVVLGGRGISHIGDHHFEWGFGDVLALPMGYPMAHEALEDATVVCLSDEPLMRWAGYYSSKRCD